MMKEPQDELTRYAYGFSDRKPSWRWWIIQIIVCAVALYGCMHAVAKAQGIYMLNGRAQPSVIVGPDGRIFPIVPNPCQGGPCEIILAPPLPLRVPPRYAVPPPYAQQDVYGPPELPCYCSPY